MNLPFTEIQFLAVFEEYNRSVWSLQILFNALGLLAVYLAIRKTRYTDKLIAGILAFLWIWIGIAYHMMFFSTINPGAFFFAGLYVIQGLLFIFVGIIRSRLSFRFQWDVYGIVGALFLLYAFLVYPILGFSLGHVYPSSPTFGLPCPTTIFTFGMLLWTEGKMPKAIPVIPFLWSLIGFSAALTLGMYEDTGLLVAGVVGFIMILLRGREGVTKSQASNSRQAPITNS